MKISWNELHQLVDLENIDRKDGISQLTLAGFEIENIEHIEEIKDTIIDVSITANRQDVTGWIQIAAEISTIFERSIRVKSLPSNILLMPLRNIAHLNLLEAYVCCIENVNLLEKYQNYARKLNQLGYASTGSILDIIDFINLKWGQSIKVYGLTLKTVLGIKNLNIDFSRDAVDELRPYIDNQALPLITRINIHKLDKAYGILLINHKNRKQNSENYCLSYGSIQCCLHAYWEIFSIIKNKTSNGNRPLVIYQYHQDNMEERNVITSMAEINKLLGPIYMHNRKQKLDSSTVIKIIQGLNMSVSYTRNKLKIKIPLARRNDIQSAADIAEEVARIYGFNNFLDKLPKFEQKYLSSQKSYCKNKTRSTLRSMGIHEIINYSFQSKQKKNSCIPIINPLNQGQEILRSNLISGIIKAKIYNINQDNINFEVFETGSVFDQQSSSMKYQESIRLSCLLGNTSFNRSSWQTKRVPLTWLQAKGQAEELFERINAQIFWSPEISNNDFVESLKPYIHPTKRIGISNHCQVIGILSKVNYLNSQLNCDDYFIEVDLKELTKTIKQASHITHAYNHYSNYPKVTRDFSITINAKIAIEEIVNAVDHLRKNGNNTIESVRLLSEYYNSRNEKTLCLRATYRSKFKTLTNAEIEILDKILKAKLSIYTEARRKPGSVLNNLN